MKIAIIAAMQKELDLLLSLISHPVECRVDGFPVYKGEMAGHTLILSQCGIGKVNSAMRTGALLRSFSPDIVINSGVAGGVDVSMRIGSVLVADKVAYHDVWCGPGTEYGEADGCPLYFIPRADHLALMQEVAATCSDTVRFGLLCSGDKFISTPAEVAEIKSHFPEALGCDMESASIAQVCYRARVPFMVIRVMSDMPGGGENISEYKNFWTEAPARTFDAVRHLIEKL